jgi:hypothetical protein
MFIRITPGTPRRGMLLSLSMVAAMIGTVVVSSPAGADDPSRAVGSACTSHAVAGLRLTAYPDVSRYPALRQHGLVPAPRLLDRMARDFADDARVGAYGRPASGQPSVQDFLILQVPTWLWEFPSGAAKSYGLNLERRRDLGKFLWIAHVAGYFGGAWLRQDFLDYDLKAHAGIPYSNAGIAAYYGHYVDPLRHAVASASGRAVLRMVRQTLRSPLIEPASGIDPTTVTAQILPPMNNLGAFGYDAAWLADLLPPHPDAPIHLQPGVPHLFTHDPGRLLDAHYGVAKLRVLRVAERRYRQVRAAHGRTADRYLGAVNGRAGETSLLQVQRRYDTYGNAVYGIGIPGASNYRGFPQGQYDRVLSWATWAVMSNQAASMQALASYASRDAALGRVELRETLGWSTYAGAYIWGHLNPEINGSQSMREVLPSFGRRCR